MCRTDCQACIGCVTPQEPGSPMVVLSMRSFIADPELDLKLDCRLRIIRYFAFECETNINLFQASRIISEPLAQAQDASIHLSSSVWALGKM